MKLLATNSCLIAALTALGFVGTVRGSARAAVPSLPTVTHAPTTATSLPYGSNDKNVANLTDFGYVQEEYFISSRRRCRVRPLLHCWRSL